MQLESILTPQGVSTLEHDTDIRIYEIVVPEKQKLFLSTRQEHRKMILQCEDQVLILGLVVSVVGRNVARRHEHLHRNEYHYQPPRNVRPRLAAVADYPIIEIISDYKTYILLCQY